MKKGILLILGLCFTHFLLTAQGILPYSGRMAQSVMERNPGIYNGWDYETGTILRGFQSLWEITGEPQYFEYIKNTVDFAVGENGVIAGYDMMSFNIDEIKEGSVVLFLYEQTGEEKYRLAAKTLRQQLETHPRTSEGGFWHKQRYPDQMWLDGLYMGSPFLAQYGRIFHRPQDIDDALLQIILMDKHAYDTETGLFYHGWDESKTQEWADPVTGCSPSFWGRAIGWYAMAIVDVLDHVPSDHPDRNTVISILQKLAQGVTRWQDSANGLWYQVVDKMDSTGNYSESSVSAMLCYTLAKAIRLGYIDTSYQQVVDKAYSGIINEFISINQADNTINLDRTCATAGLGYGRDGSYHYYVYETFTRSNDAKAMGPFISASLEWEHRLFPPSNFGLDSLGSNYVALHWSDNTVLETSYLLERFSESGEVQRLLLPANTTHYYDTDILPSSVYLYSLSAVNTSDTSSNSPTLGISTPAPDGKPGRAFNPQPRHQEVDLPVDGRLHWTSGGLVRKHNIYFGEENPPPFMQQQLNPDFDPGQMKYNTSYFWRIDEVNAAGTTIGNSWQFKTENPPPDLVGYWKFDDPSFEIAFDSSGFGNHGVLHNFTANSLIEGLHKTALTFNGKDQYAYISDSEELNFGSGSFSISIWLKMDPESVDPSKQSRFVLKGSHIKNESNKNSGKRYELFHHAYSSEIRFSIDDNLVKSVVTIPDQLVFSGHWVHLVAVRDVQAKELRFYVDGALKATSSDHTGNISQNEPLMLGFSEDYPAYLEGVMDELSIYSKALTVDEIEQLFQNMVVSGIILNPLLSEANGVMLFPNPVSRELNIQIQGTTPSVFSVELHDLQGNLLIDRHFKWFDQGSEVLLDIGNLKSGIYLVKIKTNSTYTIRKMIKY